MDFKYTVYKKQGYVQVKLSGKYDLEKFKISYHKLIEEMAQSDINSILWDARKLDVSAVSQELIRSIIAHVNREAKGRHGGRAAWVAQDELGYGMGRMFESISDYNIDIKVQVFRNIREAELWLVGED